MRYIVCESPGTFALKINDVPTILSPGNALLSVKRIGICGTDLHAYKGNQAFFAYPRILGHELSAEVLDSGNSSFDVGDKVVIMPYINCQECDACLAGKSNCCERIKVFGVHTDGGMQEVIQLPHRLLIKANELSHEEIAIVEPLSIGAHAIRRAGVERGQLVVVMGCGPIGIGIIQLCKYLGARVIAIDLNPHRLKMVKEKFGADLVISAAENASEIMKSYTGGHLANTVFDATGSKKAIEEGTNYMRHGGNLVLVGLFKGDLMFTHPAIHARETTLMCSRNATMEDFNFVIKVLKEKAFNTDGYITRKVPFENILTDFDQWASPDSKEIKVVSYFN